MKLKNNTGTPQMLSDGTTLGADYTPESVREVESISEADRARLVESGLVTVIGDLSVAEASAGVAAGLPADSEGSVRMTDGGMAEQPAAGEPPQSETAQPGEQEKMPKRRAVSDSPSGSAV